MLTVIAGSALHNSFSSFYTVIYINFSRVPKVNAERVELPLEAIQFHVYHIMALCCPRLFHGSL